MKNDPEARASPQRIDVSVRGVQSKTTLDVIKAERVDDDGVDMAGTIHVKPL